MCNFTEMTQVFFNLFLFMDCFFRLPIGQISLKKRLKLKKLQKTYYFYLFYFIISLIFLGFGPILSLKTLSKNIPFITFFFLNFNYSEWRQSGCFFGFIAPLKENCHINMNLSGYQGNKSFNKKYIKNWIRWKKACLINFLTFFKLHVNSPKNEGKAVALLKLK